MSCGELGKGAKTGEEMETIIDHDLMTLRDYFAAKAMQSYIFTESDIKASDLCSAAYAMADNMLAARDK